MSNEVKIFTKNLDKFTDEVYLWLRRNRDKIDQKQVDDILSIVRVSQSKLTSILCDISMNNKNG